MNKVKMIAALIAVTSLSGCAQRYVSPEEQAMTNAAYKGAALQAALANAHAAAFDGKEIGSDEHKHKHHHKSIAERFTSEDPDTEEDSEGVVYRHGKKGYLDADGDFIQYAQSAHRKQNHTTCEDLMSFVESGLELTPAQSKQVAQCRMKSHRAQVNSKVWKGYGVKVELHADGQVFVDGKPAALDERAEGSTSYQQGVNSIILYENGKAALVQNGTVRGYLK